MQRTTACQVEFYGMSPTGDPHCIEIRFERGGLITPQRSGDRSVKNVLGSSHLGWTENRTNILMRCIKLNDPNIACSNFIAQCQKRFIDKQATYTRSLAADIAQSHHSILVFDSEVL